MQSASRWLRVAVTFLLASSLLFLGCPEDDDDSAGDDDTGDDDVGDDDTVFYQDQDLSGVTSATPCPSCDYTLDVTYTTFLSEGTCTICLAFPDGTYTLAYDSDYYESYQVILLGIGGQWYYWYGVEEGETHTLEFDYQGGGYTQSGYWDMTGDTSMTGKAFNSEP